MHILGLNNVYMYMTPMCSMVLEHYAVYLQISHNGNFRKGRFEFTLRFGGILFSDKHTHTHSYIYIYTYIISNVYIYIYMYMHASISIVMHCGVLSQTYQQ